MSARPKKAPGSTVYSVSVTAGDGSLMFTGRYATPNLRLALEMVLNDLRTHDAGHGPRAARLSIAAVS